MENNLLPEVTVTETGKAAFKKLVLLSFIIMIFSSLYTSLNIFEWYLIYKRDLIRVENFRVAYLYYIMPVISILILFLSLFGHIWQYVLYKKIFVAIENADIKQFNIGLQTITRIYTLGMVLFVCSLVLIVVRIAINLQKRCMLL